ncbi:hypothetical protein M422DRAFT_45466 [Sphaerobolus stellatus SS14]|nr:hypothetical protein M422DRAFT_45466 [Sphaerobolus stellatus SS14]
MPEFRELYAAHYIISHFLKAKNPNQLIVQHIWADWDMPEWDNPPYSDTSTPFNHVHLLDDRARAMESGLRLKDVIFNPRHVILDMGSIWIQVQLLQHTFPQIYTKQVWNKSIRALPWRIGTVNERLVKIGIAFDFGEHLLAFVTNDFVFKVSYARTLNLLPERQIDPISDPLQWMRRVLSWMDFIEDSTSGESVWNVVRNASDVWGGCGVYTSSELWIMAGINPFSSIEEVFGNPSRVARLFAAYFTFTGNTPKIIHRYLKVYGKDWVCISSRMGELLEEYWDTVEALKHEDGKCEYIREDHILPSDVFGPSLIDIGLKLLGSSGGRLNFGDPKWEELAPTADPVGDSQAGKMLYEYFARKGQLNQPTHLNLNKYSKLFLSARESIGYRSQPWVYHDKKKIWTICPFFGLNSIYVKKFGKNASKVIKYSERNPPITLSISERNSLLTKNV